MNSWSCGKNIFAHFCNDDFFMCSEENGQASAGTASNPDCAHGDSTEWVTLMYYDPDIRPAVIAFSDPDCKDISSVFWGPSESGATEYYTKSQMWDQHQHSDDISAVMVPPNLSLTLYSKDGF